MSTVIAIPPECGPWRASTVEKSQTEVARRQRPRAVSRVLGEAPREIDCPKARYFGPPALNARSNEIVPSERRGPPARTLAPAVKRAQAASGHRARCP